MVPPPQGPTSFCLFLCVVTGACVFKVLRKCRGRSYSLSWGCVRREEGADGGGVEWRKNGHSSSIPLLLHSTPPFRSLPSWEEAAAP